MVFLKSFLYDKYNEVREDKPIIILGRIITMASLSLKNICKVYPNGFEAVKDFNLEV
jgi:multiple sugar transport system ATP-binding protein